jgi:Rab3 GTPase-activating protein catalytic subunit|tara:strand:- start:1068 stop:2192 length:1125 start_codon:yes stop_codon:yes gene_type:complete
MYTSDTHREREQSMHALGDTAEGRAVRLKVQSAVLVSDMSAFKAANPMCCLADFIRWHSPRDWEEEKTENGTEEEGSTFANKKDEEGIRLENKEDEEQHSQQPKKPPNGVLSKRMRSENNAWRALWREAPRQPACKQKKLFDPTLEGEKALEYLDQAPPPEIFVQLLAAAASAIGGVYASSSGANFSSSQEALRRAFQMTTHVFNKAVPYEHEYASVAGELQRAERAVCRGSALVHRLPKVSRDVLDALLTSAATDEAAGDLSVEAFCETAGETAGETADVTPSETPRVTRPPPKALETTLSRRHSERARGSALACLLPETTGAKNADSLPVHDIASSAEYTVLAGGGHNQTHRAHAVVAPCFLRVSSAVAYQY